MLSPGRVRTVLIWHVHGSWTEAFVAGDHRYLIPVDAARSATGRGLAGRRWPRADEVAVGELRSHDVDLVVLQRPEELDLAARLLGRRPGVDVAAVYVEHNAPRPRPCDSRHPMADQQRVPLVHVSTFNALMWDSGDAPTRVIDHGIPDRGELYTGEIAAAATMINEPVRRGRVVGADVLAPLSEYSPVDVWGIGTDDLGPYGGPDVRGRGDIPGAAVLDAVGRRRVYLHTARWTSLGLSLLEAMAAGMPVVAVGSTMAPAAVPAEAGVVSTDLTVLGEALRRFTTDPAAARLAGKAAREHVLSRYGLRRFLADWDRLIEELCP